MTINKKVWSFVGVAFACFALLIGLSAKRQGWFAAHSKYTITFSDADGLHAGAHVTLMGLKVGQVQYVEINSEQQIEVGIRIQSRYSRHITEDTELRMARPFIIGEKQIVIVPGDRDAAALPEGSVVEGVKTVELTDLLSGSKIGPYLETLDSLFSQLKVIIEGQGEGEGLSDLYGSAHKALKSVGQIQYDIRRIRREVLVTNDTKDLIKQLAHSTRDLQKMMAVAHEMLPKIANMADGAGGMMPQFATTLNEAVLTLQAMQRSFFLKSAVADIKEEQAEAKDKKRSPASKD